MAYLSPEVAGSIVVALIKSILKGTSVNATVVHHYDYTPALDDKVE